MKKSKVIVGFVLSLMVLAVFSAFIPGSTGQPEEWLVTMSAGTATDGSNTALGFGTNATATDGLDAGLDVSHPPAPPVAPPFDAYFVIPVADPIFGDRVDVDYRAPADTISWTLSARSDAEQITITWDSTGVPADTALTMDTNGDGVADVDMIALSSTTLTAGTYEITITAAPAAAPTPTPTPTPIPSEEWLVTMSAGTATDGSNTALGFGTNATATDGLDAGLDVSHPPAPPVAPPFDAYFIIPVADPIFGDKVDVDYRAPADTISWTLFARSDAEQITITWDSTGVPADTALTMDTNGDGVADVDMIALSSTTLPAGTYGTITITAAPAAPADTTAPVITNLQPADGSTTTDTTPTISASYADPESGINTASVVLTLDGTAKAATVTATGATFTPPTALTYATHTVSLSVSNNAGLPPATATWCFTVTQPAGRRGGGGAYRPPVTTNVPVDSEGKVTTTTPLTTDKATLTITAGIIVKDAAGKPLSTSITMASTPSTAKKIGAIAAYDFGPSGTTFSEPIDLVIAYDPADVPAGAELVIKMYDGTAWVDSPTTVDTAAHTATAKVSHFSIFALFAAAAPEEVVTPTPTVPPVVTPTATPTAEPPTEPTAKPWGLIIGIITAVVIVGAAAYYFYTKKKA